MSELPKIVFPPGKVCNRAPFPLKRAGTDPKPLSEGRGSALGGMVATKAGSFRPTASETHPAQSAEPGGKSLFEFDFLVIYDHPSDYPAKYVVRKWRMVDCTPHATGEFWLFDKLWPARRMCAALGLHPIDEQESGNPDPVVLESWI